MSWAGGQPSLRVRVNGDVGARIEVGGLELSYDADAGRRRCVGHRPFRDASVPWVDCDNVPLRGGRTCDSCTAVDATFASQLHHAHTRGAGELDPALQAKLNQQNHLYLAAFRDGSIKVGTSTVGRVETRLHEQGAWLASVAVTASDGYAVRYLEDAVSSELGLAQSVSTPRKLAGHAQPKGSDELDRELGRWTRTLHRFVAELNDSRFTTTTTQWSNASVASPDWENLHPYTMRLDRGPHHVELMALCGKVAVVRRPGGHDRFVCDLGQIIGLEVELSVNVEPAEITVQDSLF